jgi:hypothetical protein
MKNFNTDDAFAALAELEEAVQGLRDNLETAVDDVDQQIEDGEMDASERESTIHELMDGAAEGISILKGQTLDLERALGE